VHAKRPDPDRVGDRDRDPDRRAVILAVDDHEDDLADLERELRSRYSGDSDVVCEASALMRWPRWRSFDGRAVPSLWSWPSSG
jgi:hypothetical protein